MACDIGADYSVTPKFLRKYRKELGLPFTTLAVIESIFACVGDDGKAWPSQQTIADEIDKSVDAVQDHIYYLNDHGRLPIQAVKHGGSKVHNVYDLKPLIEFNAKLATAEEVPSMFPVSFVEWREAKRAAGRGGKRGRPKKAAAEPKRSKVKGFGKPSHEHEPHIPDFVDGHLDYEPLSATTTVAQPIYATITLENNLRDIANLVRHFPRSCNWVQATLHLTSEEFARAVEAGEARQKLVRFYVDGHEFLHTRALGEYEDDAITLNALRDSLRCGSEDLPELVKDPNMLAAAVQEGVFQSVCRGFLILPPLFAEVCPLQDLIAVRDRLCGEGDTPRTPAQATHRRDGRPLRAESAEGGFLRAPARAGPWSPVQSAAS